MNITINGKTISITDKNARAYKKMTGMDADATAVKIYIKAHFRRSAEECIKNEEASVLNRIVNNGIESEARDCYNDKYYEITWGQ